MVANIQPPVYNLKILTYRVSEANSRKHFFPSILLLLGYRSVVTVGQPGTPSLTTMDVSLVPGTLTMKLIPHSALSTLLPGGGITNVPSATPTESCAWMAPLDLTMHSGSRWMIESPCKGLK